jgi:hypothetical protein
MTSKRLHLAALVCPLAGVLALAGAAPALATDVTVAGTALRITDSASQANGIEVRPSPSGYDVFDDLTVLTAGAGCLQLGEHDVSCQVAAGTVAVAAGGGDDVVDLSAVAVAVVVFGGEGSDLIQGGSGDDVLDGGPGQDTIHGNGGSDQITGGGGDDALQGDDGADRISGDDGADIVQGQGGDGDVLAGNAGTDLVEGGAGNDRMTGGTGADVLVTGSGIDKANPGTGSDQVFGTTADKITCNSSDEVSQGSGAAADGCGRLAKSESPPDIWPKPPESYRPPDPSLSGDAPIDNVAMTAQAALFRLPVPTGLVPGTVMHQGDAHTFKWRIPSKYNQPIRVRVRILDRDGHELRSFKRNTRSKQWDDLSTGDAVTAAWSVQVKCCVR